ncbi:MAG: hypothetical protein U1E51_26090 [Candidatus Binatia bacterium]|nr:hypothetical protein [Candidatus Binatia bacterium]
MSEKKAVAWQRDETNSIYGLRVFIDGSAEWFNEEHKLGSTPITDFGAKEFAKELARLKLKYEPSTVKWPEPEVVDEWVPEFGSLRRRVLSNGRFQYFNRDKGVWENVDEIAWGVALNDCTDRIIQLKRGASD